MAYTPILGKKANKGSYNPKTFNISDQYKPSFAMSQTTQAIPDSTTPDTFNTFKSLGVGLAQGIARIPAELGVTVGQDVLSIADQLRGTHYTQQSVDTAVPTGFWADILGKSPVEGYATQILNLSSAIKKSKLAKKYGLSKHSFPLAFGGIVGLETLNFLGGEGDGAKVFMGLAKKIPDTAVGINDMYKLARGVGFDSDIAKQYAPLWAKETTDVGIKNITDAAVKLQNTTKAYEPVRSEEHTSELQSHSFISYAVFCLKKKIKN